METVHTIQWMKELAHDALVNERSLGLVPTTRHTKLLASNM